MDLHVAEIAAWGRTAVRPTGARNARKEKFLLAWRAGTDATALGVNYRARRARSAAVPTIQII